MRERVCTFFVALTLASTVVAAAQTTPSYALVNARIVTMNGPAIASGTLVMRDGRIAAVAADAAADAAPPNDAIVIDASGWTLYPGFVDAHAELGMPDAKRESAREAARRRERGQPTPGLHAHVRASSVYQRDEDAVQAYRRMGIAVAAIAPRSGILRGQSAVVALGDAASDQLDELVIREPWAQHVGYEPFSRARNDYPGTLMGVLATLRQSFGDARWYRAAWERYEQTPDAIERPAFDESLAALGPAAFNQQHVVFSAWSDNAILRTLRLADELSIDAVISGAIDGWRVADSLAATGVPVLVSLDHRPRRDPVSFGRQPPGGLMPNPGADDEREARANAAKLNEAGVRFALTSAGLESIDSFLSNLRATVEAGLPEQAALEALTLTPARFLGLDASVGTLEPGKAAHVIAVEGDLFDDGRVAATWIDGRLYENDSKAPRTADNSDSDSPAGPDLRARWERTAPRGPLWPEAPTTAIRHATILTVTNGTISPGTVIINEGRIQAVGPDADVTIPSGAREIDASGMFVMPGIVDAHIHIGIAGGGNESTRAVTPEVRMTDVIDHRSPSFLRALAGGVTTVNVLHGSANVIGGQNAVLKLRWGRDAEDLFLEGAQPGIKFALGENPKQTNRNRPDGVPPRYPGTRMGVELTLRTSFTEAQHYRDAWRAYEEARARGEDPMAPRRDARLEALGGVLDGSILVHAHCYRSDEILMLLRVAEDFGFRIASLQHVLEGYKVADEIAAHGAGGSTFADNWGYKMEALDAIPYNATLMAERGVVASINSDAVGEMTRRLYIDAAKAMKYGGASERDALQMITLNPAKHLRLDDRLGSIEVGKDADLGIYTAHPFTADAHVQMTIVDGQIYFDRDKVETTEDALTRLSTSSDDGEPEDPQALDTRYAPWSAPDASSARLGYGDIAAPELPATGEVAIVGGRVMTADGTMLDGATVLVRAGRIVALGTNVDVPRTADTIDARGMTITPGMINAGTTLGIAEISAVSATQDVRELQEVNASAKASVAVHPHSDMIPVTRANGVTTALTIPAGGLVSGQAALIDLAGWTAPEVVAKSPVAMVIDFPESLELAPDDDTRKRITSERKTLTEWMRRARAHAGAIVDGNTRASSDHDELQALVPVVRGEMPVLVQADSEEGIRAALAFADELGLNLILQATRDVWRVVDDIAQAGVPVVLGPTDGRPAPGDPYDALFTAASLLDAAGVPFCFRTGGASNARNLPYTAGLAVAFGLPRERAWHAMTRAAAEILGVAEDYGSLEVGKVANIVVADGDLLDVPTNVKHVLIRGRRVDLGSRHSRLYEQFKARPMPTSRGTDANP